MMRNSQELELMKRVWRMPEMQRRSEVANSANPW